MSLDSVSVGTERHTDYGSYANSSTSFGPGGKGADVFVSSDFEPRIRQAVERVQVEL
jgi:hypothetical protein